MPASDRSWPRIEVDAYRPTSDATEEVVQAPDKKMWTKPELLRLTGVTDSKAGNIPGQVEGQLHVSLGAYNPSLLT